MFVPQASRTVLPRESATGESQCDFQHGYALRSFWNATARARFRSGSIIRSRPLPRRLAVGSDPCVTSRKPARRGPRYRGLKTNGSTKRNHRKTGNDELNQYVYKWFVSAWSKNIPISGSILQVQARKMAKLLIGKAILLLSMD